MFQLGELEAEIEKFNAHGLNIMAGSTENVEESRKSQSDFPSIKIFSDHERDLARALDILHVDAIGPGNDAFYPTTLLIDEAGTVRDVIRPSNLLERMKTESLLDHAVNVLGSAKS